MKCQVLFSLKNSKIDFRMSSATNLLILFVVSINDWQLTSMMSDGGDVAWSYHTRMHFICHTYWPFNNTAVISDRCWESVYMARPCLLLRHCLPSHYAKLIVNTGQAEYNYKWFQRQDPESCRADNGPL